MSLKYRWHTLNCIMLCVSFCASVWVPSVKAGDGLTQSIDAILHTLPKGAQWSVIVGNPVSGHRLVAENGNVLMTPASVMKLVTATAALEVLGKDFRYSTQLLAHRAPGRTAVLKGGMVMAFSGDPTLQRGDIDRMLLALKQKGIRSIDGTIWLDGSRFSGYANAEGVVWDDLSICFAAQPSAIILNRNCFYALLKPGKKVGQPAVLEYARPDWPMRLENHILTTSNEEHLRCPPMAWPSGAAEYSLKGCMAKTAWPLKLAFAVNNPGVVARDYLAGALRKQGIEHKGPIVLGKAPQTLGAVLAEHRSAPLSELLVKMLETSDNLYADSLLKTLGYASSGKTGSYETGIKAVYDLLGESIPGFRTVYMQDGSGLSRYNLISANTLYSLLARNWQQWRNKAPWLINRKLSGRWYKTGTMKGVSAFAGYTFAQGKAPLLFVVIINGLSVGRLASAHEQKRFRYLIHTVRRSVIDAVAESQVSSNHSLLQ